MKDASIRHSPFRPALFLALALAAGGSHAQVVNGSFEAGNLTGWTTTGGTGQVTVVQNANFRSGANAAAMPAVPDGNSFVALSTGPGPRGTGGSQLDGNATNDFDAAVLNGSITFSGRPAVLIFDWNFSSSEANASPPYDDFFDVRLGSSDIVFSGSVLNATANTSNYPDVPATGLGTVNWTMNIGVLNGVSLTQGVGQWRRACIPIAAATQASFTLPLRFRVADQGDNTVDSVLLIDNVRVQSACDASPALDVTQLTTTSGSSVEVKGSGFLFRPVQQRLVSSNRTSGSVQAFVSSANLTGDNPGAIEQVFVRTASGFSRVMGLSISAGGQVQSVGLSDDAAWMVIAARPTAADNLEIYRYQRGTSILIPVTSTSGCSNTNAVISQGASPIVAFESTCGSITGQGTTRKVVYATFSGSTPTLRVLPAGNCVARNPAINRTGRYIGMESSCNPPGRSNTDLNTELFVFDTTSNQTTTSSRWRQATVTTGATTANFGISLAETTGTFSSLEAVFISTASLVGTTNSDGSTEVYRWVGNNTTSNNGTVTQVTNNTAAGKYYTQVVLASASDYFAFERLDATFGTLEVGSGRSTTAGGGTLPVAIGGNFLGLGVAENATQVLVPFVAAEDLTGANADGNYELFQGRTDK